MPIYEYECRGCGHQFELLVLKGTAIACPSCKSEDLERLLSGFGVSSEGIREANIKTARRAYQNNKNTKDKKKAEEEHIHEHIREWLPPKD